MRQLLAPVVTLLLAGCASTIRTPYVAPALPVAEHWDGYSADAARGRATWWRAAGDADLEALVERVLSANSDLAAAGLRLEQARLSASLVARQFTPTLSANLADNAVNPLNVAPRLTQSASASLTAAWEVDLFGRLGAQRDAAGWAAEATEQDLAATRLALIGTTVTTWWQLAHANRRLDLARQSLANAERTLALVEVQYRAGAVSGIALQDSRQAVETQRAGLPSLEQAGAVARATLGALVGEQGYRGPERLDLPTAALPAIDPGIPADILARRPDLAGAERRLRQTLAQADANRAALYPSFSLTAGLGTASSSLLGILANPVASVGGLLSTAALNPDRIRLGSRIARLEYDVALTAFRQTFYDALRDTASALSRRRQYSEERSSLERSYAAAREAEGLYERRYRNGAVPLREWLDAQERRRSAEIALLDNRLNALTSDVALHQALGDAGQP